MTNDNSHLQAAVEAGLVPSQQVQPAQAATQPAQFDLNREQRVAQLKQAGDAMTALAAQVWAIELYSLRDENNVRTGFTSWRIKVGNSIILPFHEAFPLKLVVTVTDGLTGTGMLVGTVQTVYAGTASFEDLEAEWGSLLFNQWIADFQERDIDVLKIATNVKCDIPAGALLALCDSQMPYELVLARA